MAYGCPTSEPIVDENELASCGYHTEEDNVEVTNADLYDSNMYAGSSYHMTDGGVVSNECGVYSEVATINQTMPVRLKYFH